MRAVARYNSTLLMMMNADTTASTYIHTGTAANKTLLQLADVLR